MIKIFLTVRNRLAITKKCIEAIENHTKKAYQLYVFNNLTDYLVNSHFDYFKELYENGRISQIVFNTSQSTFNAFSKAVASNQFGYMHQNDPNKDQISFLLFLDNDIILTENWDQYLASAWNDVNKYKMENIKIISQLPGGIKEKSTLDKNIAGCLAKIGKNGGSGLWSTRSNFFSDVGFLDIKKLVGFNKRHDQMYWKKMEKRTNGKPYILGIKHKIGFHTGPLVGSVCNKLEKSMEQKDKKKNNIDISFSKQEEKIDNLSFEEFYSMIKNDKKLEGY